MDVLLNVMEISSVSALGIGILIAARKASIKPILNNFGLLGGALIIFPALHFVKIPQILYSNEVQRHQQGLFAAAITGSLFTLGNGKFLQGAQLGMAVSTINSLVKRVAWYSFV